VAATATTTMFHPVATAATFHLVAATAATAFHAMATVAATAAAFHLGATAATAPFSALFGACRRSDRKCSDARGENEVLHDTISLSGASAARICRQAYQRPDYCRRSNGLALMRSPLGALG
jgi:hypothetical protein